MMILMPTEPGVLANLLRALGDDTRLQILALLAARPYCVCELVDLFPIHQPAVSGHLRRLKAAELVTDERRGQWVYYALRSPLPPAAAAVLAEVQLPPALAAAASRAGPPCSEVPPAAAAASR